MIDKLLGKKRAGKFNKLVEKGRREHEAALPQRQPIQEGTGGLVYGRRLWINNHTSLFAIAQEGWPDLEFDESWREQPVFLPCVGIQGIEWGTEVKHTCQYCGAVTEREVCPQCQNPALQSENFLGRATVTLLGPLPTISYLFHAPDGMEFRVTHRDYGLRSEYAPCEVILRLSNCKIVRKWLPDVLALIPDDTYCILLHIAMECDVELYPDGLEE